MEFFRLISHKFDNFGLQKLKKKENLIITQDQSKKDIFHMTVSPLKSCLCMFTSHWTCRFCASPLFLKTLGPSFSNKISKKRKFDFPLTSWCLSTSMEQFMQSSVLKKNTLHFYRAFFVNRLIEQQKYFAYTKGL